MKQQPDISDLWTRHQRQRGKTTSSYACLYCPHRRIFVSDQELWNHALQDHHNQLQREANRKEHGKDLEVLRRNFIAESAQKRAGEDDDLHRTPTMNRNTIVRFEELSSKIERPLSSLLSTELVSEFQKLNIRISYGVEDMDKVVLKDSQALHHPWKRVAVGDDISAGSASLFKELSASPSRRSKARPTPIPRSYGSDAETRQQDMMDTQRPYVGKKQLRVPEDGPVARTSIGQIVLIQTRKSLGRVLQSMAQKSFQSSPQVLSSRSPPTQHTRNTLAPSAIFSQASSSQNQGPSKDETLDIILQLETRPISQEQLLAEVKEIYAGLVMVEAKCIEVDNKQAALAQAAAGAPPKLNNEQWQALIALHRTLLHEHHDFFLASQHPSASPALRRLTSKYAMPARMWRHGIHSFLELLRHRLPASLDHMLAFIYLAYSMMALLYETVPAFEDTWIECLGDLGRYRMAIEDDDIRDREVWTGVARHWYSKASDKAPTTGRLYHHLAILARPNALQQLFYFAKSLYVAVPFTSTRESILILFEPVLNSNNQYRLPPLDTAFVKAHGLLFTNKDMQKFDPTVKEFLSLLDSQIGRVTRKFMEQGYHIAVANSVAMLGFAAKDNALMKAISPSSKDGEDTTMEGNSSDVTSQSMISFKHAQRLSNSTTAIVLQRIGDPNVLPFIHVTLVFIYFMSRHPGAMSYLEVDFPWEALSIILNTLLDSNKTPSRIEDDRFPLPEKDDVRPFPEDFAMRGLLWAEDFFPEEWFTKQKIDEAEKYHERASMTAQRKERILWLACRIAISGQWIVYNGKKFSVPSADRQDQTILSRESTFASGTTNNTFDRAGMWASREDDQWDSEEDLPSPTMPGPQGHVDLLCRADGLSMIKSFSIPSEPEVGTEKALPPCCHISF